MTTVDSVPKDSVPLEVQRFSSKLFWAGILLFAGCAVVSLLFLWGEQHGITSLQTVTIPLQWSWTFFAPISLGLLYIQVSGGIRIELHESGIAYYTRITKPYWWAWDAYGPFILNTQDQRSVRRPFLSKTLIRVSANKVSPAGQSEAAPTWSTSDISLSITGFPAGKSRSTAELFVERINDRRQQYLAQREG